MRQHSTIMHSVTVLYEIRLLVCHTLVLC